MIAEYRKTWPELKGIIQANNLYFNYEVIASKTGVYVQAKRNPYVAYLAKFPWIDPADPLYESDTKYADWKDFNDNWAWQAGEWSYYKHSWSTSDLSAALEFRIVGDKGATDYVSAFVFKGAVKIDAPYFGDKLAYKVVDKDNVLGYGAGVVLRTLIDEELSDQDKIYPVKPPRTDGDTDNKFRVVDGLYCVIEYTKHASSTASKLIAGLEYESKEARKDICNGCGAFVRIPSGVLEPACDKHDIDYWRGGFIHNKMAADIRFYWAMLRAAWSQPLPIALLYTLVAQLYFLAVHFFGHIRFHYGKRRKYYARTN